MNITMDKFIEQASEELANMDRKKSFFKSLAFTGAQILIGNLIAIPFGFTYVGTTKYKSLTKEQWVECLNKSLYDVFVPLPGDGADEREWKKLFKDAVVRTFDNFSPPLKGQMLSLAINDQREYIKYVKTILTKLAS